MSSVRPIDECFLESVIKRVLKMDYLEEHGLIGGLGTTILNGYQIKTIIDLLI